MIYFNNDYAEGCHPKVLEALIKTNMEQAPGYGTDDHCRSAADRIRSLCKDSTLAVHFLVGGTQANLTVIDAALRPHQGVVGADTAHINVHETGAVEATGHKVLWLPGQDGKITAEQIRACVLEHRTNESFEHTVQPKMVYLSNPTELGTLYSLHELEEISSACRELGLYLFVDGARLGYGLMAEGTDVTLADIARLTDVFYIGGTKVGALCGEAVVFPHGAPAHFMTMVKQQGALLAKGRLLGIQFDVLFTDDLYTKISKNAIDTANALKKGLAAKGYRFFMDSPTNQVFVILDNTQLAALEGRAKFGFWEKFDDSHTVVRIATSWATCMEEIEQLIALM